MPVSFVREDSIVRKIWGRADTILLVFAGASAEFALNKAVDWLYFTGKLPADPLGRLFSTVEYAREIVFSDQDMANKSIDRITSIHAAIEHARGARIPDWAYRDVLFMLIDYSIRSYELVGSKMNESEKEETFDVFHRVGKRMNLQGLPADYNEFLAMRQSHLETNLCMSAFSADLFKQYRKHLGPVRFYLLLQAQKLLVPSVVKSYMKLGSLSSLAPVVPVYRMIRRTGLEAMIKEMLFPAKYKERILKLDMLQ